MGTQLRTQKKYPAASVETHRAFKPQGFTVKTQLDTASQPQQRAVDWPTQLSRAKRFGHNLSQVQVHPNPPIQRQVAITQRKAYLQRSVVDEEQERDEESSEVQMKSDREQNSLLEHLPTPDLTPKSSSQPLPKKVQAKMENSIGTSRADVPLHEGSEAKSVGALAYTQGNRINFAPKQFKAHTCSGQSVLGNELTHVVQQRAGRVPVPSQSKEAPVNANAALAQEETVVT